MPDRAPQQIKGLARRRAGFLHQNTAAGWRAHQKWWGLRCAGGRKAPCSIAYGCCFCRSLMETSRFPLFGVSLAGFRPGGRPTFLLRQESRQRRRPRRAGRLLKPSLNRRLPCAAHNRRPARNSRAAPAQTAAPDSPACCCAARRLGRGFSDTPSVAGREGVIGGKAGSETWEMEPQQGRSGQRSVTRQPMSGHGDEGSHFGRTRWVIVFVDDTRCFSKASVSAESPF